MTRTYNDYCPVAHSLEAIGDRWSLLIIRDLLRGPQRFSDLLHYSNNITAKWLMIRLRQLEQAGVIEREKGKDRREVWYKLTAAGQDLHPVIEALAAWGLRYKMGPPQPGEAVHPDSAVNILINSFNRRGRKLAGPATWLLNFTTGNPYSLSFDGDRWSAGKGDGVKADITVTTSPASWVTFLAVRGSERTRLAQSMQIDGDTARVREFFATFGLHDKTEMRATPA